MKKRGLSLIAVLFAGFFVLLELTIFVSAENETISTIKCYSSKDCPITPQYWCDSSSACQKLAQCLNPGTVNSECSVVDECVNCINIGYLGCKDGQCQKISCYQDSECGASFTKRYCKDSSACTYESAYFCQSPGTVDSFCNVKKTAEICVPCSSGCVEGRCSGETQQPIAETPVETQQPALSSEPKCSDTDGGLNYYEKGSTMWGSDISSTDSCEEDGITLREEGCVLNPGPNQGTMLTSIYKCPNGCKDGACIRGEKQREEVKCIFKNTETQQKCYRAEYNWMYCSSYQGSCIVTNLEGYDGEKITWKSTCGGYAYTILDGNNEQVEFDCSGVNGSFCQSSQCDDGSWSKCYVDGSGYCTCTPCSKIIAKPVCGNGVCESGEGEICMVSVSPCEAGKECKASIAQCKTICSEDCKGIEGIQAKLNEKFKLQVNQPAKIIDYKNMKIIFRDLLTPKCEAASTNVQEVKAKLTAYAVAETPAESSAESVEIIKCPEVGPMAQLEIISEEQGNKILTLKLNEAKNIYDVGISFLDYDFSSRTGVFVVSTNPSTCPENCKCNNEGYVLECKTEEKCEKGKMLCPDGTCKEKCEEISVGDCTYGCVYNNKCLSIGIRVKGLYCEIDGVFNTQLAGNEACENNFECESNVCIDGECISSGLIKKVLGWLKRMFGGE